LFHALVHQFGGQFMCDDGLSAYKSEAGHKALQWIVDMHNTGWTSRGLGFGDVSAFWAGRAGMHLTGPWVVNSLMRQDSDEKYLAAMKLVKWFYDNYALPAVSVGIIPVSPNAQADPIFTDDERYQYMCPSSNRCNSPRWNRPSRNTRQYSPSPSQRRSVSISKRRLPATRLLSKL